MLIESTASCISVRLWRLVPLQSGVLLLFVCTYCTVDFAFRLQVFVVDTEAKVQNNSAGTR